MNILAIDTTTKKANVGVCYNKITNIKTIDNEITHSEKLLPLINDVLNETNCNIKNIDTFACTTGPGSFTGIRIGLATIKALAKVTNSKIFSINSLELLANSAIDSSAKIIVPLIDAKNTRAYYGMYENSNGLKQIHELGNKYIKEIIASVHNYCNINNLNIFNDVLFVLDSENLKELFLTLNELKYIIASLDMSLLLSLAATNNSNSNYIELDATYVRSSEAERTKYGE